MDADTLGSLFGCSGLFVRSSLHPVKFAGRRIPHALLMVV